MMESGMRLLQIQVGRLLKEVEGDYAVVLHDLASNERWGHQEKMLFTAESIIKIPIMAAIFRAAHEEQFHLSDSILVRREDLVGGSGILQHLTAPMHISVYDLITLMIIQSDNTATNVLINSVGKEYISQTMLELEMVDSTFTRKLMIFPVTEPEPNMITAADVSSALLRIVKGQFISTHACDQMVRILKKQQFRDALPSLLPEQHSGVIGSSNNWELAHKTGWDEGVQHDAGILYAGGKCILITVLSKQVDVKESRQVIGQIGKMVYQYAT
ncbi:serine hydrolase [Brevibacillus daliensis]|uniref:serine hydrolase n=1 Tax=Brevibacillus daliensis TaxID=2892995 RepID=UPI001E52C75B|nr:serine hydrolase [Brevibacillus daliensis]